MLLTQIVVIFSAVAAVLMSLLVWGCVRGIRGEGREARFKLRLEKRGFIELLLLVLTPFAGMFFSLSEHSRSILSAVIYVFDALGIIVVLLLTWGCIRGRRVERSDAIR